MKLQTSNIIKVISTVAIASALGLEAWNLSLYLQDRSLPSSLNSLFWLASIALIIHAIEGAIAAVKASSRKINPLTYGVYTFFVGFIGLKELSDS